MKTDLIRKLSLQAMSEAMNIDAHTAAVVMRDVDKMYIPDCYRDRLVKLVIKEAITEMQDAFDMTVEEGNHLEDHFGID